MAERSYNDLAAFVAVAEEHSFTKAARKLGVSQSALSQTIRSLEERLGMRLLARTTRRVSPTEIGMRLLEAASSGFSLINVELENLRGLQDKPAGTIRITTGEHAAETIVWPALQPIIDEYPDIRLEITSDAALSDIIADRYDAGIRLGEQITKDMIAVRIGPDMRMAAVGSPSYFNRRPPPIVPQDLTSHDCINVRMPSSKSVMVWEFVKDGRELNYRPDGRIVISSSNIRIRAALNGMGIAYLLEDHVREHLKAGRLRRVLEDWCPPFPGYHIYYPSRRQHSPAFRLVIDTLRFRDRP